MRRATSSRRIKAVVCVFGLGLTGWGVGSSAASAGALKAADSTPPSGSSAPAGQPGPGDFGDLKGVCGPGDGKGSTAQGVTDSEISVATISDPGYAARPGLNQELFDTADAFAAWCNAAGGINGRKIKLNKYDAKITEVAKAVTDASQGNFMLVGNGEALDIAAFPVRAKAGLGEIAAYVVSEQAGQAEFSMSAMPSNDKSAHLAPLFAAIGAKDPDAKKSMGVWNNNFPSVAPTGNRTKAAAEKAGFTISVYEDMPSGIDNYRPFVEKLKEKNVQVLVDYHSPGEMIAALKTMADVGYFPKYITLEANFYDAKVIQEAGAYLDKTTFLVHNFIWPFEMADQNPATKQFVDILKNNGGFTPRGLGVNSWSAWSLFAVAVKACGSEVTRDCVLEKAKAVKEWTGGGLHAPIGPGNTTSPNSKCVGVLQATPAGFVSVSDKYFTPNDRIFFCDDKNNVPVDQL